MKDKKSNSKDDSGTNQSQSNRSQQHHASTDDTDTPIGSLQRSGGNQAIQRLVEQGVIQPKLTVSNPDDESEKEAERVAETVMRMSDSEEGSETSRHGLIDTVGQDVGRSVRDQSTDKDGSEELESRINSLKGGGRPLPGDVRSEFEAKMGHDFSGVRVHTGGEADEMARSINAEAFTHGEDVVVRSDRHNPSSHEGKKLMAHELTHVVQQEAASANRSIQRAENSSKDGVERPPGLPKGDETGLTEETYWEARSRGDVRTRHGFRAGMGEALAKKRGYQKNPDCPWVRLDPINWETDAWTIVSPDPKRMSDIQFGQFPEPLPYVDSDGNEGDLPLEKTVEKANDAIDNMFDVSSNLTSKHNETIKAVKDYNSAAGDAQFGQFTQDQGGLNWQMESAEEDTDVGELAEQQTPNEGGPSIGEAFSGVGGGSSMPRGRSAGGDQQLVSEETTSAASTEEVMAERTKVANAERDLEEKVKTYENVVAVKIPEKQRNLRTAYKKLEIAQTKKEKEQMGDKKNDLKNAKEDALEAVNTIGTIAESVGGALSGDTSDIASGGAAIVTTIAESAVGGYYKAQIEELERKREYAENRIMSLGVDIAMNEVKNASSELKSLLSTKIPNLESDIQQLMQARQKAYDNLADVAASTAMQGGGSAPPKEGASRKEANKLRTVIMAIPRIKTVLGRIGSVLQTAKPPAYDPKAGLALAVARDTGQGMNAEKFLDTVGRIKGFRNKFKKEKTKWQQRLNAAEETKSNINVPSG